MARILLGVSGSIAAYKALEFVRLATGAGHGVRVVLTEGGRRFVGPDSFAALTGAPVLSGVFDDDPWSGAYPGEARSDAHRPIGHLALAERADLFVIAPASANTVARLAGGFADDLLTAAALVAPRMLVAPAMNNRMWDHPATKANIAVLRSRGVAIAEPGTGRLASKGEQGAGRLAEPAELMAAVAALLSADDERRQDLAGQRVLISAGGTREPLDAVRFLGNRSSGRMGFALAEAAAARGAYVTVVAANVALPTPPGIARIDVETAAQLQAACDEAFTYADVLIAAAAVADFRPATQAAGKMKKLPGEETRSLELERTPDVLAGLAAARRPGQVVVGFAAEHGAGALDYGRDKLARKRLDAIVVNDVSDQTIGFDSTENEVVIVTADREVPVPRGTKRAIADAILDVVGPLRRTGAAAERTPVSPAEPAPTGHAEPAQASHAEPAQASHADPARAARPERIRGRAPHDLTSDEHMVEVSGARRAMALAVAKAVAEIYGDRVRLRELPDSEPLAPTAEFLAASGDHLLMLSANAVATTIVVGDGPASEMHQLDESSADLVSADRLAAALRAVLDAHLG